MKIDESGIVDLQTDIKADKKPVMIFTIADDNNLKYAKMLENSLRKFHKDVPFTIITGDELKAYTKDPMFFYRATPIIAEKYIKDYELVIKIDADSIVTGSLDYVFDTKDYDVATVINWNREDYKTYGYVQGWGILPVEYFNAGFVAMRSQKFIEHWKTLCFTAQFDRLQYKEQDLLNALCYYGNYNVRCLDHYDGPAKMQSWWGLISKGEWLSAKMVGDEIMIPKGDGATPFPAKDTTIKVIHWGGGQGSEKMNYRTRFSESVIKRLDHLVS